MSNASQFVRSVPDASMARHRCSRGISSGKCVLPSDENLIPRSIGLGVFHQGVNSNIRRREKEAALIAALNEMPPNPDRRGLVVDVVTALADGIKKFYDAPDDDFIPGAGWEEVFAKDACYIIQFFSAPGNEDHMEAELLADIFLPSNQIPLFLLVKIMRMYRNPQGKMTEFVKGLAKYQPFRTDLCPLVVSREDNILNFLEAEIFKEDRELSHHLLHLLHKSIANILEVHIPYVMVGATTPRPPSYSRRLLVPTDVFKCLEEYNITFRERIGNVWFHKRKMISSILYLPSIRLEDDTILFHRSLMAFDWKSSHCNLVCDLTFLLHLIVDDNNRKFFSRARIIRGRGERFCTNLNNIFDDLKTFYIGDGYHGGVYRSVIDQLDEHTQVVWNEWMYRARDWVVFLLGLLSLFAAIFFGVVNEIRK